MAVNPTCPAAEEMAVMRSTMTTVASTMTTMTTMTAMTTVTSTMATAVTAMTTLRICGGVAEAHYQARHAKRYDRASAEHGARR